MPLWIFYCKPSKFKLHYKVLSIHGHTHYLSLSLSLSLLYFRQTPRQIEDGYKYHRKSNSLKPVQVLAPFPPICGKNSVVLLCSNFMLNKFGSYSMVNKYNLSLTRQPPCKIEMDLNAIYHLQVRYHVNISHLFICEACRS